MADQKISELTALAATPATNDYFVILDTDVNTTKKVAASYVYGAAATWTPTILYFGGTTDPTSWVLSAQYHKTGRVVTVNLVAYLTRGSGNRTHTYFTLPFESNGNYIPAACLESVSSTSVIVCPAYFDNTTRIAVAHGAMTNSGRIQLSFCYIATA